LTKSPPSPAKLVLEVVIAVGHADRIGSAAYNQKLSEKRAASVKDYLVSKGIPANRVYTEGKGSKQPVTKPASARDRRAPRLSLACNLTVASISKSSVPRSNSADTKSPASAGLFCFFNPETALTMQNADPNELDKFSQLAHRWWDPDSEFKPLHRDQSATP
jgi:hypothetical protein